MLGNFLSRIFGSAKSESAADCPAAGGCKDVDDLVGFVKYVAGILVNYPEQLDIQLVKGDDGQIIQVRCEQSDIGKIVGKRGKTIMAIRSLVSGAAGRLHQRVSVDVLDK